MTGLALQNLGNTATSYSGTLFYDQNGQLGQFQGFNNVTHEYRINNVALNGASQLNGSINFMIGGSSRFFASNTGVGIGTTAPSPTANLDVSNAVSGSGTTNVNVTTYSANPFGPNIVGKKARGTQGAPNAVLNNDALLGLVANGYGATGFASADSALISMRATEDWTDTAQGSAINFSTTANGTTGSGLRMTIGPTGNVGIGTAAAQGALEVFRTGDANLFVTSVEPQGAPQIATRAAHGTSAAPSAVQVGDFLGVFGTGGHNGTSYTDFKAGFAGIAAENWTGTAQGTTLVFAATPIGSSGPLGFMSVLPSGFVGIGTPTNVNGLPTATDKLQVFGDIRVGNAGTNGCLKSFDGTGIAGTCSSDRRFKRDITPFGSVLKQLTALQPVHFYWRAAEFPDRHFGEAQTYGLIAQDVEQVFPELVVTGEDGFKAIDYSRLPLLTIQAVKELKAENDDLKAQNDALKERVTEVERLLKEMLATKPAAVRSAKP
jgi:Chaperone of endosialidase